VTHSGTLARPRWRPGGLDRSSRRPRCDRLGLAVVIADRVGILMDGKLIFLGPPSELKQPKDPIVADFLTPKIDLKNPRFKQLET